MNSHQLLFMCVREKERAYVHGGAGACLQHTTKISGQHSVSVFTVYHSWNRISHFQHCVRKWVGLHVPDGFRDYGGTLPCLAVRGFWWSRLTSSHLPGKHLTFINTPTKSCDFPFPLSFSLLSFPLSSLPYSLPILLFKNILLFTGISVKPWLSLSWLCRQGWPSTHRGLPASASPSAEIKSAQHHCPYLVASHCSFYLNFLLSTDPEALPQSPAIRCLSVLAKCLLMSFLHV